MNESGEQLPISGGRGTHGFVVFADIEGYSKNTSDGTVAALTEALCDAARVAFARLKWSAPIAQCTGDGFIVAPQDLGKPDSILEFIQIVEETFSPARFGADLEPPTKKLIRWGIDYGAYLALSARIYRRI